MNKRTLIIECDGVLYPSSEMSLGDFVHAMKTTFHQDVKLDAGLQQQISEETLAKKHLGMFNYIKAVCDYTGYGFSRFCERMQGYLDYSKISQDLQLGNLLTIAAKKQNVVILTNNHISHLDKVLRQRFNKSVFDMENEGIRCFDIQALEHNGVFYPKQDAAALSLFAERIGVTPQNCTLIDDSERNLETARKQGMQAILINENFTLKHYLLQSNNMSMERKAGRGNG